MYKSPLIAGIALLLAVCAPTARDDNSEDRNMDTITTVQVKEPSPTEKTVNLKLNFNGTALFGSAREPNSNGVAGKVCAYTRWIATDYVDISAYAALKYELAGHRYLNSISFFDSSKKFISGISTVSTCGATALVGSTEVPENAKYAVFITFRGVSGTEAFDSPSVEGFTDKESYLAYTDSLKNKALNIACIGDSITEGDYGGHATGVSNKRFRNYPYYLQQILGGQVVNQGACGATATSYLNGIAEHDISDADIILIMFGANGGLSMGGDTTHKVSFEKIIDYAETHKKPGAQIILMTPTHTSTEPARRNYDCSAEVANAAEEIRSIAAARALYLIDCYADSPIQADMESVYQPYDGLHLSQSGYRALAEFIAGKLILTA